MAAVDCTVFCTFLTASTLAIRPNQTYAIVTLSTNFKIQFDYYNPTINAYPAISNVLDLQDANTGQSLLTVSMPWTTGTVIGYNGLQIEQWGPTVVRNYAAAYTTFTIVVSSGYITITSSSNPSWSDSIAISSAA